MFATILGLQSYVSVELLLRNINKQYAMTSLEGML